MIDKRLQQSCYLAGRRVISANTLVKLKVAIKHNAAWNLFLTPPVVFPLIYAKSYTVKNNSFKDTNS